MWDNFLVLFCPVFLESFPCTVYIFSPNYCQCHLLVPQRGDSSYRRIEEDSFKNTQMQNTALFTNIQKQNKALFTRVMHFKEP